MPAQYRAIWSVPGGGTGYSVFHFTTAADSDAAQEIADQTRTFFQNLSGKLPDDVSISFDPEVVDLTEEGALVAVWPVSPGAVVNGTTSGAYSRAAGCQIVWSTDGIVEGRRLKGRTFIVPIDSAAFGTTGVLLASAALSIKDQADAFLVDTTTNRPLRVWSRTHTTSLEVQSTSVPQKGAILRSRRD